MANVSMITTVDNPYDPFDDFDAWYAFDVQSGYHTCAYLARVAFMSHDLSEEDQAAESERAIDEIIFENPLGIYKKVTRDI